MASNPDVGDLHVNALLTQVSIGFQPSGFFADRAFPLVNVDKQTDIVAAYNQSFWARDLGGPGAAPTGSDAVKRAPGTRARTATFTVDTSTNTYRAVNYALGFEIPDELRNNADAVFDLDRDAVTLLSSLLKLRFDREFTADFMTTGVWGTDGSVTAKFNTYATSTPIEDIRTAVDSIRQKTLGMSVDGGLKVIMGALVKRRLMDHPDILDRIKYTGSAGAPAKVSLEALASLFEVDEVIVGQSVYTSDEEGGTAEASVTYADVLSDDVLVLWTPKSASRLAPSGGYLFNWRPLTGGGMTFVRKGRQERERLDWIEVHAYLDWVKTFKGAGYFFDDATD